MNKTSNKEKEIVVNFPRIYVGPSLEKGYLKANMVFADGYPQALKELFEKYPFLESLIVPTKDYFLAVQQVAMKGSYLNNLYLKAKEIKING